MKDQLVKRKITKWPEQDLEIVSFCPACSSQRKALLHSDLVDRLFQAEGEWNLYKCQDCQSAFLNPRPSEESIHRAYQLYYTHNCKVDNISNIYNRMMKASSNAYLNAKMGTKLLPQIAALAWLQLLCPGKVEMLEAKFRLLPHLNLGNRLLDVGCGSGDFLALAASAGWETVGVDPDPLAVAEARTHGHVVYEGDIASVSGEKPFNAITLSHVIEHVHDPILLLETCYGLLGEGGHFWIQTPNIGSDGHRRYGRNWRGLEPPRHLTIFSRTSLIALLQKAGFKEICDAPWAPQREALFPVSEALSRGSINPNNASSARFRRYWLRMVERFSCRSPATREFITLVATK